MIRSAGLLTTLRGTSRRESEPLPLTAPRPATTVERRHAARQGGSGHYAVGDYLKYVEAEEAAAAGG
jgi:hypothetical protein